MPNHLLTQFDRINRDTREAGKGTYAEYLGIHTMIALYNAELAR
jgi:hypothetical protein